MIIPMREARVTHFGSVPHNYPQDSEGRLEGGGGLEGLRATYIKATVYPDIKIPPTCTHPAATAFTPTQY
jgi:hypothetical protein